jgi:hypothetical protein
MTTTATLEVPCRACKEWIPIDEGLWAYHVITKHDVQRGEPVRDIALWYMDDPAKRRDIQI